MKHPPRIDPRAGFVSPRSLPQGPNGFALCRECSTETKTKQSTFCSPDCVHAWKIRSNPGYARQQVWERDHGQCALCPTVCVKSAFRREDHAWHMDHIVPVVEGGGACGIANLRTLCLPCHRAETAALRKRLAMRRKANMEPFRTVICDAPWSFNDSLPGDTRGAAKRYQIMALPEIKSFLSDRPGIKIADDAFLFMWRVSSMQQEALSVIRAWGFEQKSEIVWCKQPIGDDEMYRRLHDLTKDMQVERQHHELVVHAARRVNFGMGRTTRLGHEVCLIAKRGSPDVLNHSTPSVFFAPIGEHSEKPEKFFEIVEKLSPGPYLELFARRERAGWTCLGNELDERNPLLQKLVRVPPRHEREAYGATGSARSRM